MIEAIAAGIVAVLFFVTLRRQDAALLAEQARVTELLRLLESKAAPAEVAAFLTPHAPEPEGTWIFTEDGLVGADVTEDGD